MFYNYRTSKSCKTDCGGSKQIMLVEMPGLWMMWTVGTMSYMLDVTGATSYIWDTAETCHFCETAETMSYVWGLVEEIIELRMDTMVWFWIIWRRLWWHWWHYGENVEARTNNPDLDTCIDSSRNMKFKDQWIMKEILHDKLIRCS